MKIAHLADTHLGCIGTGWQRSVPDPFSPHISLRQQEADIKSGFAEAVERILSLQPDLVIHTGDLFDHSHPNPHAVQFAFMQLQKLSASGIPLVILEGDHSAPRVPAQGEPLQILSNLPGVQVVCGEHYQMLRVKDVLIHALPHRALLFEPERRKLAENIMHDSLDFQILIGHGVADGLPFYQTHRTAATVWVEEIAHRFDYVALGHCHRFCQVVGTNRAFYSGSTAMVLSGDFRPGVTYGFNLVTLHEGQPPVICRELLDTRPMRRYGLSDASRYSAAEIMTFLTRQLEACPAQESYCRVVIENIDPTVRSQLAIREIERLFPLTEIAGLAIHVRVRVPIQGKEMVGMGKTPRERFLERTKQEDLAEEMRDQIITLGCTFFDQAEAELRAEDQEAG